MRGQNSGTGLLVFPIKNSHIFLTRIMWGFLWEPWGFGGDREKKNPHNRDRGRGGGGLGMAGTPSLPSACAIPTWATQVYIFTLKLGNCVTFKNTSG